MKLEDYLKQNQLKPIPWAEKNGIATSVISRFLSGKGLSKWNALKIQNATNSEVTVLELLFPVTDTS